MNSLTIVNPFSLAGIKLLVTGASSGIGSSIAIEASKLGAKVFMLARNEERLLSVYSQLQGEGHQYALCDICDSQSIHSLSDGLVQFVPNAFVHSAGVRILEPIRYFTSAHFEMTFNTNIKAALELLQLCRSPKIRQSKERFSTVFISSAVAGKGQAGLSLYSASKGAIESLVPSLAVELARENILVNAVAPGYIEGEMLDNHKALMSTEQYNKILQEHLLGLGKAQDIAWATCYLLSPASRWVTGAIFNINGGYGV